MMMELTVAACLVLGGWGSWQANIDTARRSSLYSSVLGSLPASMHLLIVASASATPPRPSEKVKLVSSEPPRIGGHSGVSALGGLRMREAEEAAALRERGDAAMREDAIRDEPFGEGWRRRIGRFRMFRRFRRRKEEAGGMVVWRGEPIGTVPVKEKATKDDVLDLENAGRPVHHGVERTSSSLSGVLDALMGDARSGAGVYPPSPPPECPPPRCSGVARPPMLIHPCESWSLMSPTALPFNVA